MNKRFTFKNKLWLIITSIVVSIILLALCVVNILQLCEVGNFKSFNHALHITSTVVSVLVIALLLGTVFGSAYRLTDKGLLCNIGLIFYTISYEKILKATTDANKNILILYVKADKDGDIHDEESGIDADILPIVINPLQIDSFIEKLKAHKNSIIYEISTQTIEHKKNRKDKK